jgi:hypothetical protein
MVVVTPSSGTHAAPPIFLNHFRELLRVHSDAVAQTASTCLSSNDRDADSYVPFEYVNTSAKLVLVGITPGPMQIRLSYRKAQQLLRMEKPDAEVLREIKIFASFGGTKMRSNLVRMLKHFEFGKLFRIADEDVWGRSAHLLHATSVIPHAAFARSKKFGGSFDYILASDIFRESFERDFILSLARLAEDAWFVALGPTPLATLNWCANQGLIASKQILGAFPHPSPESGSQVAAYLGEKLPDGLGHDDPVQHRLSFLVPAYRRMLQATNTLHSGRLSHSPSPQLPPLVPRALFAGTHITPTPAALGSEEKSSVAGLYAFVSRGRKKGTVLRPHIQDNGYIVSMTRYEKDYIRVPLHEPLERYLRDGFSLRMSAPGCAPSLISPRSIRGWRVN